MADVWQAPCLHRGRGYPSPTGLQRHQPCPAPLSRAQPRLSRLTTCYPRPVASLGKALPEHLHVLPHHSPSLSEPVSFSSSPQIFPQQGQNTRPTPSPPLFWFPFPAACGSSVNISGTDTQSWQLSEVPATGPLHMPASSLGCSSPRNLPRRLPHSLQGYYSLQGAPWPIHLKPAPIPSPFPPSPYTHCYLSFVTA